MHSKMDEFLATFQKGGGGGSFPLMSKCRKFSFYIEPAIIDYKTMPKCVLRKAQYFFSPKLGGKEGLKVF